MIVFTNTESGVCMLTWITVDGRNNNVSSLSSSEPLCGWSLHDKDDCVTWSPTLRFPRCRLRLDVDLNNRYQRLANQRRHPPHLKGDYDYMRMK